MHSIKNAMPKVEAGDRALGTARGIITAIFRGLSKNGLVPKGWPESFEYQDIVATSSELIQSAMNAQELESGWLIEKGRLCLGSCGSKPSWVTFTDPTAVRFARKVDAENMLASLRAMSDKGAFQNCTINDHRWQDVTERLLAERGEGR